MYLPHAFTEIFSKSAHAPVNGGPVFPGTFLGHFCFLCVVLVFLFYQNFQIPTPWCNAQVSSEPVKIESEIESESIP